MERKKEDKRRFAEDKPENCTGCYFWNEKKKGCSRKECYYLLPEKKQKGSCKGCPYGRYMPCIGYCLLKILLELHLAKGIPAGKEGENDTG